MNQISRFVIWICARFNREQIELIVKELSNILKSKQDFPTKPKDAFKEQHPNYREYTVDPTPPLTEPGKKKNKIQTTEHCSKLTKSITAVRSSQSRFKTENPSPKTNNAHSAKRPTHTCTTTTARRDHNFVAKSAHQTLTSTIVIKERLKPNITALIATERCSAGKSVSTSLCTNAAMITAHT